MSQNPQTKKAIHLSDRRMIRVAGPDAEKYLQDIITNDMRRAGDGLLYACLLSPQGQYLHDFFIFKDGDGFIVDTEAARTDDLLRRMNIFKLRAKVEFSDTDLKVYSQEEGRPDPRHPMLGSRYYTPETLDAYEVYFYHVLCIALGIPCGSLSIRPEKETMSEVNLDLLNAVAWDKGCFIGQEVAARMHNKSIAKRRLFILIGENLSFGAKLMHGDIEAGEVRQASHDGTTALAVIKVPSAGQALTCNGAAVTVVVPDYLKLPQ